jgi:thioesterase domain-containing protein/acyl carrier protein
LGRLWSAVLAVENVGIDDDFFELGGDSLLAVRICAELESELGARLAASRLWEAATVRRLAAALEVPPDPRRRLVAIQPHGRRPPLVCVPGAQGSALAFAQLARWLGDDQPLYAFEAPGTDGLEPPLDRVEDLASRYLAELTRLQPRGPYQLAGYSVGGLVALEMAQRLVAAGEAVDLVALLDSAEPKQVPLPVVETARRLRRLAGRGAFQAALEQAAAALGWSVKRRVLPWVVRVCQAMGQAVPPAARRWQVIQAHVRARAGYRPRPYPGPLTLVRAVENGEPAGAPGVWAALARGGLVVRDVAGSHDFLVEPFVGALARELAACLLGPSSPACRPRD